MGISLNVDTNDENEFNQQLQMYLAQGYSMQSNFNGTAILKKKSYSEGLLIVLIILFFPAAIIYYLVASDDVVTIRNTNGQSSSNNSNTSATTESFDSYCEECGHGLFKDSKFCPGCGNVVEDNQNSNEIIDEPQKQNNVCKNCGEELYDDAKFCPNCGEDTTTKNELEVL